MTNQLLCEWSGTYVNRRLDMMVATLQKRGSVHSNACGKSTSSI